MPRTKKGEPARDPRLAAMGDELSHSIPVPKLQRELLVALRGRRSQTAMSRKLGYSYNQVYRWETGRTAITWAEFVRITQVAQRDIAHVVRTFLMWSGDLENGAEVLRAILGERSVAEAAALLERSPHQIGHWLAGRSEVPLSGIVEALLKCIPAALDFLGDLAAPATLPCLAELFSRRQRQIEITRQHPFSGVLLEGLELAAMQRVPEAVLPEWLSCRLSLPQSDIKAAIADLKLAGLVASENERTSATRERVNLARDFSVSQTLRSWWLRKSAETLEAMTSPGKNAYFGYMSFSANQEARERLRALSRAFYEDVWAIIRDEEARLESLRAANDAEALAREGEARCLCVLSLAVLHLDAPEK